MTGFSITAPPGLVIEHAHEVDGWTETLEASTATWADGSLAPDGDIPFGATIAADAEPGVVEVIARQRYADGGVGPVVRSDHDHSCRRSAVAEPRARGHRRR